MNIGGLDTETPEGNLAIIGTDEGSCETEDIDTTLRFLMRFPSKIFFTFNLRFDAQAIIKQIPEEYWEELWKENKIDYKNYHIFYIPKKLLSISKGFDRRQVKLYDIAQFYKGYSLDNAAKEFLQDEKISTISAEKIGESRQYYEDNLYDIKRYCIQDAILTKKLGLLTKEKFEAFNFGNPDIKVDFSNPLSPASLSGHFVDENYEYPLYPDKLGLGKLHAIARKAFRGGFFQTFMRGYFDQPLYDYDINSAYPSNMIKLPHWGNGAFILVQDYDELDTDFGWILSEFDCEYIPYNTQEPFIFTPDDLTNKNNIMIAKNTRIVYPSGKRQQVVTKLEYDWMKKHGFNPKFLGGIYWIQHSEKYISPFSWMEDFYYERLKIKKLDFPLQWSMKIFMNGLYGKTAQNRNGIGQLTNFFYASYICAMTRIQVAEVVFNHKKDIINVATDGLLSLVPLKELELGSDLGTWEQKEYEKGLVVGNGILQLWNKDETYKTKARGITENTQWDMMKAIEENKELNELSFSKKAPVQLGEIMMQKLKYKPQDLNRFVIKTKVMRVNCDESNQWNRNYINYDDLLNTKTIAKPLQIENIKPRKVS